MSPGALLTARLLSPRWSSSSDQVRCRPTGTQRSPQAPDLCVPKGENVVGIVFVDPASRALQRHAHLMATEAFEWPQQHHHRCSILGASKQEPHIGTAGLGQEPQSLLGVEPLVLEPGSGLRGDRPQQKTDVGSRGFTVWSRPRSGPWISGSKGSGVCRPDAIIHPGVPWGSKLHLSSLRELPLCQFSC